MKEENRLLNNKLEELFSENLNLKELLSSGGRPATRGEQIREAKPETKIEKPPVRIQPTTMIRIG